MFHVARHPHLARPVVAILMSASFVLAAGQAMAQGLAENQGAVASASTADTPAYRGLSSEQIHAVMGEHRQDVRVCVAEGDNLPMRLDLIVDFVIGPSGAVERATVYESNAGNEAVESCIVETISGLLFPQPDNGRAFAVRYPFVFVTGG